ncbi:hypothetical protein M23134_04173 [Microscilla marina ATCC 23134]|uniref:Uncharacterized protein n=1 Tax=Microscilla marina ATCC 23134 TaxID=313606 RepID=A1ZE32_MICM2|nr:hypothetical protein M23134_04173 [Microscilla marina ATCC 23134]
MLNVLIYSGLLLLRRREKSLFGGEKTLVLGMKKLQAQEEVKD